jgi:hypothetical protein
VGLEVVAIAPERPAAGFDDTASRVVLWQPLGFVDVDAVDNLAAVFGDNVEEVVEELGIRALSFISSSYAVVMSIPAAAPAGSCSKKAWAVSRKGPWPTQSTCRHIGSMTPVA